MNLTDELNKVVFSENLGYASISIDDLGILQIRMNSDMEVTYEEAYGILDFVRTKFPKKRFPHYIELNEFAIPSKDVREFMVSEERVKIALADAMVLKSLPQKLMGNLYLQINKPKIPTKFFNTKEAALEWLTQFTEPRTDK